MALRTGSGGPPSSLNEECFIKECLQLLGVLVLQKGSKILLCVFLEKEQGPCPQAALLSPDSSFLVSASPSLPDEHLPFGTQGSSWRLKLIP